MHLLSKNCWMCDWMDLNQVKRFSHFCNKNVWNPAFIHEKPCLRILIQIWITTLYSGFWFWFWFFKNLMYIFANMEKNQKHMIRSAAWGLSIDNIFSKEGIIALISRALVIKVILRLMQNAMHYCLVKGQINVFFMLLSNLLCMWDVKALDWDMVQQD